MKDKIDFYYFTMTPKVPILQGGIINIKKKSSHLEQWLDITLR